MNTYRIQLSILALVVGIDWAGAQWVQTGGPRGGVCSVYGVVGTTVYIGMGGKVLRSSDAGMSWSEDINLKNVSTIVPFGNMLLAATTTMGILRSSDMGRSWTPVNPGLTTKYVSTLFVNGTFVFAGTDSGAFRSSNGGDSWQRTSNGLVNQYGKVARVYSFGAKDGFVFAGISMGGVFRSSDNGDHWTSASVGWDQYAPCLSIATQGGNLYAAAYALYCSTDNGGTWTKVKNPAGPRWVVALDRYLYIGSGGGGSRGLYRSSNSGVSWDTLTPGRNDCDALAVKGDVDGLFVGTSDNLFRSSDLGASWTELTTDFKVAQVSCLVSVSGTLIASGYTSFRSTDRGVTWVRTGGPVPSSLARCGTTVLMGTANGVLRSTDMGLTWLDANTGLEAIVSSYGPYRFSVIDSLVFLGTQGGVFLSTNQGRSWYPTNLHVEVQEIVASGNVILAAGTSYPFRVFRSADRGDSWTEVAPYFVNTFGLIDSTLFLSSASHCYRSSDRGVTWIVSDSGLPAYPYMSTFFAWGKTIFAAVSAEGVYRSTDGGLSWRAVNEGLSDVTVQSLTSDGTYLYAGTYNRSVWRRSLSELTTGVGRISNEPPLGFALHQNYPNPFNPATTITYQLPAPMGVEGAGIVPVQLSVFDLLGREVATLVNEVKNPGTYSVRWDAGNVASGVYYCRIQAGSFIQTRKILLIR